LVGRYYENGIPGDDCALDAGEGGKWKMRAAVIGFKALSGPHSGVNLGRYAVGLLDCVGIMDKKRSKAGHLFLTMSIRSLISDLFAQIYMVTLDNTGNNNTTCKTIEEVHNCRGLLWNSDEQQLLYAHLLFS
jgi:hypothetical protein